MPMSLTSGRNLLPVETTCLRGNFRAKMAQEIPDGKPGPVLRRLQAADADAVREFLSQRAAQPITRFWAAQFSTIRLSLN
jgi:hypothetical protein